MTRRRKRLAIAFATFGVLLVAYLTLPAIGSVSPEALSNSVASHAGTIAYLTGCTQPRPERWSCAVVDSGGSGSVSYAVVRVGRRCWTARKVSPDESELPPRRPRAMSGCVKLVDQL